MSIAWEVRRVLVTSTPARLRRMAHELEQKKEKLSIGDSTFVAVLGSNNSTGLVVELHVEQGEA